MRRAFTDPAGGSGGDSFTLAVARDVERDGVVLVLELVREVRPPFSPEAVCADFARVVRSYGLSEVTGDHYAGEWPREQFRKHGVEYVPSTRTKSEIYGAFLPLLNTPGKVELLDNVRLLTQLAGLERRTARGGRDTIDHAPSSHDDLANAAAGALVLLAVDADEEPFMLFGGAAHREWLARHEPPVREPEAEPEPAGDVVPASDPARESLLTPFYRAAQLARDVVRLKREKWGKEAAHGMQELAEQKRDEAEQREKAQRSAAFSERIKRSPGAAYFPDRDW